MINIVDYSYDNNVIKEIKKWSLGNNWPVVYIVYCEKKAYVGETLDARRRTEQHLNEVEFDCFERICFISNMTYNKSVILDLESFLIKYMSADGSKELINGNAGIYDHNYFYKEAYVDEFKDIWRELVERGIVHKSLLDIENSELYKYSPYKSLNEEQQKVAYEILGYLSQINNASKESIITVKGGAGTGKTILAVYLIKLLSDIIQRKRTWNYISDSEDSIFVREMTAKLDCVRKIGFVVPMNELRQTMKKIFVSIDGLDEKMVLAPEDVVKTRYDILVVDEAHRLYKRKNLPGGIVNKFDSINKKLMGDGFNRDENDYTELDWIIRSSNLQVLFYDEYQTIRVTDVDYQRFDNICKPHLFRYVHLYSQMRCKGGNGYYKYVKDVLEKNNMNLHEFIKIPNYELKVFDRVEELISAINDKDDNLSKVVTGPGWSLEDEMVIEGIKLEWATGRNDIRSNAVFSIHKIQGFDLNYAGVIFGKEMYYDEVAKCISVNKKELRDNRTKSAGDKEMRRYVLNIYLTLMTRGIYGTYIYAIDQGLRDYLKTFMC